MTKQLSSNNITISFANEDYASNKEFFYNHVLLPFGNSEVQYGDIKEAKILAKSCDVKTVYDITLAMKESNYDFLPGDTIGIFPCNCNQEVSFLMDRLKLKDVWKKKYEISIVVSTNKKIASIPKHIPHQCSLKELFTRYICIRSVPKKAFLKLLSDYTKDEVESSKLRYLSSPAGATDYIKFIAGDGKSLLGILNTFPSCEVPVIQLIQHLPTLKPRPYSIASSPLISKTEIHFAISILEDKKGLCSGWLQKLLNVKLTNVLSNSIENNLNSLDLDSNVPIIPYYFRKPTKFRLPEDCTRPIIMIGTGTGIAPFIGFLQHRDIQKVNKIRVGSLWLLFGCRYSERDYLYKEMLKKYLDNGLLTKLHVSCSREQPEKIYVQHNILKYGRELLECVFNDDGIIYVCGDGNHVSQGIKTSFVECIMAYNKTSKEDANRILLSWQNTNKYIEDIWI